MHHTTEVAAGVDNYAPELLGLEGRNGPCIGRRLRELFSRADEASATAGRRDLARKRLRGAGRVGQQQPDTIGARGCRGRTWLRGLPRYLVDVVVRPARRRHDRELPPLGAREAHSLEVRNLLAPCSLERHVSGERARAADFTDARPREKPRGGRGHDLHAIRAERQEQLADVGRGNRAELECPIKQHRVDEVRAQLEGRGQFEPAFGRAVAAPDIGKQPERRPERRTDRGQAFVKRGRHDRVTRDPFARRGRLRRRHHGVRARNRPPIDVVAVRRRHRLEQFEISAISSRDVDHHLPARGLGARL